MDPAPQAKRDLPIAPLDWRRLARRLPSWPVLLCSLVVAIGSYWQLPNGGLDWRDDIAPAVRAWYPAPWREGLPLAPWAALLLSPLGALPDRLGTAVVNGVGVVSLALVLRRLGGRELLAIPVFISPFGLLLCKNGQTDCLVLAGLLLGNGLDVGVLATKPQVAIGAVVARLSRAGPGRRLAYLVPAIVLGLASLVIWPGWPLAIWEYRSVLLGSNWNAAPRWPWGLLVAGYFLWRAWRTGRDEDGVLATPFLFPYVNAQTWIAVLLVVAARWPRWFLVGWCLLWAAVILVLVWVRQSM